MYTNPSQEIHKEIKQQLFEYFLMLCRKDNEKRLSDTFKLVKLIVFYLCSMFSLTMHTLFLEAFNLNFKKVNQEKNEDHEWLGGLINDDQANQASQAYSWLSSHKSSNNIHLRN